ncbi:TPA: hypothetical protein ACGROC_004125, partial [Klebsiella aerogenes]
LVNTSNVRGFSLSSNLSMPPGFKPPQHCASPGEPGLASILLLHVIAFTTPFGNLRGAFQPSPAEIITRQPASNHARAFSGFSS